MLDWFANNHQIISTVANVCMLVVWIAYLQVFVSSYRRQQRPQILVNRGAGSGLDARCLLSNMSAEPIYVDSVLVTVESAEQRWTRPVTDPQRAETARWRSDQTLPTRQGPLLPGYVVDIGSFRDLVDRVLDAACAGRADPERLRALRAVEVRIIAIHGSEDLLAGAIRHFDLVVEDDGLHVVGEGIGTRQIRSRRQRRRLAEDLLMDR